MNNILVNKAGPFNPAFRTGLIASLKEAIKAETTDVFLLVPLLTNLDGGPIEATLGREGVKHLKKDKSLKIKGTDFTLHLLTKSTASSSGQSARVVLATYITPVDLESITPILYGLKSCVFVPWMDAELAQWSALKSPVIIEAEETEDEKKDA